MSRVLSWICSAIVVLSIVALFVFADFESSKLENKWVWTPASGFPTHYIVEKIISGAEEWEIVDDQVSAETIEYMGNYESYQGMQVVEFILVSSYESYQIRVRAVDAAGNVGAWSVISELLQVVTAPGKPIVEH